MQAGVNGPGGVANVMLSTAITMASTSSGSMVHLKTLTLCPPEFGAALLLVRPHRRGGGQVGGLVLRCARTRMIGTTSSGTR